MLPWWPVLFRKRTCSIGGLGDHCMAESLDTKMKWRDYLRGGAGPGKRGRKEDQTRQTQSLQRSVWTQLPQTEAVSHNLPTCVCGPTNTLWI